MTLESPQFYYNKALEGSFKDSWLNKPGVDPSYRLLHLIYKGCVKEALKAIKAADPSHFRTRIGKMKLTASHLAVIRGDKLIIEGMAAHIDKDIQDAQGWTPAHHAAVKTDAAAYNHLWIKQLVGKKLNRRGGSAEVLFQISRTPSVPDDAEVATILDAGTNEFRKMSQREFGQITGGAVYTNTIFTAPAHLLKDWCDLSADGDEIKDGSAEDKALGLDKIYSDWELEGGTKLYLKKLPTVNWALFAKEEIGKFNIVSLYEGEEIGDTPPTSHEYRMDTIDAKRFRGLGAFASDSFPNVISLRVYNVMGKPHITFLLSLCTINPGDQIFLDYATHTIKQGTHLELNGTALKAFFQATNFQRMLSPTYSMSMLLMPKLNDYSLIGAVRYLANTPSALYTLYFSGTITIEDLEAVAKFPLASKSLLAVQTDLFLAPLKALEALPDEGAKRLIKAYLLKKVAGEDMTVFTNIMTKIEFFRILLDSSQPILLPIIIAWYKKFQASSAEDVRTMRAERDITLKSKTPKSDPV